MKLLDIKPPLPHLVLTGSDALAEVIERADTASGVREIKHAYRKRDRLLAGVGIKSHKVIKTHQE